MTRHPELPERDRRILAALVQAFIEHGEPISSLKLATRGFGVSSATLRNVMVRLEDGGYLRQPHTSAGRVPTDLGYRLYVDQLLADRRSPRPVPQVEEKLRNAGTVENLLSHASQELSRASHQLAFAIGPATADTAFAHLDFVPLDGGRVLVVLVSTDGQVTQKVVEPPERLTQDELQQAANYVNSEFSGRTLATVRHDILERLREERTLYDALLARALWLANTTFETLDPQPSVAIQGTSLLLDGANLGDPNQTYRTMKVLVRMMEEKARLVELLDQCLGGPGLTVIIGSEHQDPELQPFSIVTSTYSNGMRIGAVGVIGLTRMRYSRAISVVESLSRAIDRVFDGA